MERYIEVDINYTNEDVKMSISYIMNRIYHLKTIFSCFIIAIIGAVLYGIKNGFGNYGLIITLIFCLLLFYSFYYSSPIDTYVKFYKKRKGGKYIFTKQEIKAIGEEIKTTCAWSVFKKAYEIPYSFLLIDDNKFMHIFPKRCFEDSLAIEQMQQLITEKILYFKRYC